jgi:hypothetical protein
MLYTKNLTLTADPGGDSGLPFLFLALPVMNEPEFLQRLLDCISIQSYHRFRLFVCVNQPETWWHAPDKSAACENNAASLRLLQEFTGFDIVVIDRSSKGNGWTGKRHGVGYARKTLMDQINAVAGPDDIIVSMDADSVFPDHYLRSIAQNFLDHPESAALSVPYFHKTPANVHAARAMLRYEIYMRYYFLNLARIGSPYAFTALGSAMALPVRAYRAIGGMTPKLSGEDFYFLQKLRKYGHILLWNEEMVYPEARFSDRVFFGTGPAMIKGAAGDWSSYPVYPCALFDEILETCSFLPQLYLQPLNTKIVRFLCTAFREEDPFQPLRLNNRDIEHFIRAFHEKFDGLRILQYLKTAHEPTRSTDEENLREFLKRFYPSWELENPEVNPKIFSFSGSPLEGLEKIRMFLFQQEMEVRFTSKYA